MSYRYWWGSALGKYAIIAVLVIAPYSFNVSRTIFGVQRLCIGARRQAGPGSATLEDAFLALTASDRSIAA